MYYLKDNDGNLLKIAKNEKAFTDSLFNPGGTCSGYIKKIYKHSVFFVVHNKEQKALNNPAYKVNRLPLP